MKTSDEKEPISGLAILRKPFPDNQISILPKPYKKDSPKGNCNECGGYHGLPAAHLKYVGHAALTDRLLDADPHWNWEPLAFEKGTPVFDQSGGLWIRLTVCGVTRLGYGNAQNSSNKEVGSREKEIIGDALRNAAMRFGAALDLWHKGDLHSHLDEETDGETTKSTIENHEQKVAKQFDDFTKKSVPNQAPKFQPSASVKARADAAPKLKEPLFQKPTLRDEDLGSYIITFGKHRGKMLSDFTKDIMTLDGYIVWLKEEAVKENKPLRQDALELCNNGEAFIKYVLGRNQSKIITHDDIPPVDEHEDISY